jgi:cold shock CspA family protein
MTQKEGKVIRLIGGKGFGFIQYEGVDYFFHKDDFDGHWHDLEYDFSRQGPVAVTFKETLGAKGPRAGQVKRVGFPDGI